MNFQEGIISASKKMITSFLTTTHHLQSLQLYSQLPRAEQGLARQQAFVN
jgi:hypothetical protein